ncbi:MAG: S8 family serine peptidase, partial [Clostridia bacterium]|nr:S8 family serine peptidase [Clostridia bacterium]
PTAIRRQRQFCRRDRYDGKKLLLKNETNPIISLELETNDKEKVLEAINKLKTLDIVLVAEPSYVYETEIQWTPSDSQYSKQWGCSNSSGIQAEMVWNYTKGSTSVKVGIMESGGIDMNHEDLRGRVFAGNYATPADGNPAHGTHIAGIIGAAHNGLGIAGVSESSMYLLNHNMPNALAYATQNGIKVVNASFRYTIEATGKNAPYNATDYTAIKNFNGLLVCSAGNEGANNEIIERYPCNYNLPNVIAVGNITKKGERASDSNYGKEKVHVYAPGEDIYSTLPNNDYGTRSGTSMAAPHVTGVAALLLSLNPSLTGAELKQYILNGADNINISTPDGNQNVKKLNAYGALKSVPRDRLFESTENSYYKISSENHLKSMELFALQRATGKEICDGFTLTQDITLSGQWTPIQTKFAGSFYGNGHTIRNMNIHVTDNDLPNRYFGFFRQISNGAVSNLRFENCNITTDNISNENEVVGFGILSGSGGSMNNITVSNCTIKCSVGNSSVGGLTGFLSTSSDYCSNCTVEGGGFESSGFSLGGMIGRHVNGFISGAKCYTKLTVNDYNDSKHVGKICGYESKGGECGGDCNVEIVKNPKSNPCVATGTLITLADGRQVPVETLTGDEMLLVWNLQTGCFDTAPILFIDSDPWQSYKVINLAFSDGTSVKVIYEHGFWDYDLNKYVYIKEDAVQYIGHWFNKQTMDENGNFVSKRVQLTNVVVQNEDTATYSPVTYGHLCYYVNGMLSMPGGISGLFNIFDVDSETMSYDLALMQADIEQYGLFTYEEFAEFVPVTEGVFEAFNGQYLKVAIGKGMITIEELQTLATRYQKFFNF